MRTSSSLFLASFFLQTVLYFKCLEMCLSKIIKRNPVHSELANTARIIVLSMENKSKDECHVSDKLVGMTLLCWVQLKRKKYLWC